MITTHEELEGLPCFSIVTFCGEPEGKLIEVAIKNWDSRWETTYPGLAGEDPWNGNVDWHSRTMIERFGEFKLLRRGLE